AGLQRRRPGEKSRPRAARSDVATAAERLVRETGARMARTSPKGPHMSLATYLREGRPALKWTMLLLAVWALLAGRTYFSLGADPWLLSLFHLSFLTMLLLVLPKPRVDAYSFLALFLFLGFWVKFVAHQWFDYPFIEPTGAFNGSADQWNTALVAASA